MIRVNADILIDDKEIQIDFIHGAGPGGQNVNKVASAVQLRFDIYGAPSLPDDVRQRLIRLAGKKISENGILVITARRFRTQHRNRQDAIDRLVALIQKATIKPKPRLKTRPSAASERRMMDAKRHHSNKKRMRKPVRQIEE